MDLLNRSLSALCVWCVWTELVNAVDRLCPPLDVSVYNSTYYDNITRQASTLGKYCYTTSKVPTSFNSIPRSGPGIRRARKLASMRFYRQSGSLCSPARCHEGTFTRLTESVSTGISQEETAVENHE